MNGEARDFHGMAAFVCAADGPPLNSEKEAVDIIGEAFSIEARLVVIPVGRLGPGFLRLSSRLAGEVLQKFVNYGIRVAIVGDIAKAVAESTALRDFVRESNRGRWVWFLPDEAALEQQLAAQP